VEPEVRRALAIAVAMCACSRSATEYPDRERPTPTPVPAVAPAPTPAPASSSAGFTVEYRSRGHFPTCRGNERIRVDAQGGVFHQLNDRDCDSADGWSAPYGAPRLTLSADERAKLASVIQTSGVLDLPPETADGARSDGRREELEIDIAGRRVVVAVDRTTVPAFTQVRQALIDLAAR
jgi:hypothetical protein